MTTTRGTHPLAILAAVAAIAAAGGAASPNAMPSPAQRGAQVQTAREFVTEKKRRLPGKKKSARGMRDPLRSQPWKRFKNGDAIDGRGDLRSAKRELRRRLCAEHGVTTGRQWVRLRRALRHAGWSV